MLSRLGLVSIFLIVILCSCAKEYSYEGGPPKKCLTCSYLPLCDSSKFTYIDSSDTGIDTLSGKVSILGDSTIKNRPYTKVSGYAAFNQGLYFSCANDDYRIAVPLTGFGINTDSLVNELNNQAGLPFPITPGLLNLPTSVVTSILKPSQPVNATWTDTVYNFNLFGLASLYIGLDYKILAKGTTYTVLGKTYSDVIHVQGLTNVTSNLPLQLPPVDFAIDYYFSKDVGMIESTISSGGVVTNKISLVSYQL